MHFTETHIKDARFSLNVLIHAYILNKNIATSKSFLGLIQTEQDMALRLLQYYQNTVKQKPGFNNELFRWKNREADRQNVSSENIEDGLLSDEVSIQDDLVLEKDKGVFHLKVL